MDSDREGQNGPALRAASALRAQLRAPRSKCLLSVLATLQPDQYELVTKPAMESFIVEGQPGTGKTIIAAHRAAYLVHAETAPESSLDGRILLIGPTSGYTNHVRSAVTQLSARSDRIKVLSLPELMNVIVRRRELPPNSVSTASWQDGDWRLGRFARAAIAALSESGGRSPSAEDVYDYLRHNGSQARPITRKAGWAQYLRRLPPFTAAVSDRVHLPLIAFIQWELDAPASLRGVEVIIVDEAQDVSELEWHLLQQINEADAWTIFGDLNQRQARHLQFDWAKLLDILALDEQTTIRTLSNGYRSTRPILDFANRLLPTGERTAIAIQREGPEPLLDAAEPKRLGAIVLRHIERLLIRHPKGTVAVIGPDLSVVRNSLRKARWRAVNESLHVWERDDREITVLDPATARGVEFDAVIVVEPADFERDLTKRGTLYTALTRPNRELVVVHTKPLPKELRRG
ncbi:hypothetical protein CYL16_06845 [Mycobacterium sp. EPG1]|nr:hypothetical protein CYL16_06845 [Mycobacterium sp. EPG1]